MRPSTVLPAALALALVALLPAQASLAQEAPPPAPDALPAVAPLVLSLFAAIRVPEPAPAVREVVNQCVDQAKCDPPTTSPQRRPWAYCEQWHDLAAEVGWPESDGLVLSYIIHRESRCNANAHNPSGATGLLQLLGWQCEGGCMNPRGNLKKGLELRQKRGWCDWYLRGDPVTGRACG